MNVLLLDQQLARDISGLINNWGFWIQNELTVRSCNDLFEVKRRLSTCQFSASLGDVNVDAIDSSSTNWSHKHSTMSIGDSTGSMEPDAGCSISITVPSITKKAREDPSENQSRPGGLAKVEKACMTPQEIAKWIDRRSRVAFPTMFAVANLFYWSFISIWIVPDTDLAYFCSIVNNAGANKSRIEAIKWRIATVKVS